MQNAGSILTNNRPIILAGDHSIQERPRRHTQRARARRFGIFSAVLVGTVLLTFAAGYVITARRAKHAEHSVTPPDAAPSHDSSDATDAPSSIEALRRVFRHSVIPGGASDAGELMHAAHIDPVVAQHYLGIDLPTLRSEALESDQFAYVSYRRGDRIYWTKNKVRIPGGETILTNGKDAIRGRCGNCISMEPMLPTSDAEPDAIEFDALTNNEIPLLGARLNAFAAMAPAVLAPADAAVSQDPFFNRMPPTVEPLGLAGVPLATATSNEDGPEEAVPGAPGEPTDLPPDTPTPIPAPGPPGTTPPGVPVPPSPDFPGLPAPETPGFPIPEIPEIPGFPIPDRPEDGFPNPPDDGGPGLPDVPIDETPESPPEPASVPEPGTLLLLVAGIAGLMLRRRRSEQASSRCRSLQPRHTSRRR